MRWEVTLFALRPSGECFFHQTEGATTTPARGVNWDYSPTFGQPAAFDDYQAARLFSFSVGVRF